jgi:hypothetical protein
VGAPVTVGESWTRADEGAYESFFLILFLFKEKE